MWCHLTGRSSDDFNREFYSRLWTLNCFTGQFPDKIPRGLIWAFEAAVMESLCGKFSEDEIQRTRMQFSLEEPGGTEARELAGFPE
ncbi:MAG: hypothetical protein JWM59_3962 [Verrucomicrobiales bacterium]|nr:hypothetical protein [Verrucomicrobiales bacterium]